MAKREVKRSFTFEQQRQEINLIADDAGDKDQLDTLSTAGQSSLVEAINEVIDTPEDEVFVDQIADTTAEQRMVFVDEATRVAAADYLTTGGKADGTLPAYDPDFGRLAYDALSDNDADRFTYNSNNNLLRVPNLKADIRNRNQDSISSAPGQEVLDVNTEVDGHSPSDTARLTGRLRTQATNAPVEIQKTLLKLEQSARAQIKNGSAIDLYTGQDVGAYVNVTNNKKILYVSADDENATDIPTNDGSNINRPFKSIERALIEAAKRSYVAPGVGSEEGETGADLFENFTILLFPGEYIIDNSPGVDVNGDAFTAADIEEEIKSRPGEAYSTTTSFADELKKFNPPEGGLIVPRGTSIVGLDLRKTLIRPKYVPDPVDDTVGRSAMFRLTGACYIWQFTIKDTPAAFGSHHKLTAFEYANYHQLENYYKKIDKYSRLDETTTPPADRFKDAENLILDNKRFIASLAVNYVVEQAIADGTPGGNNTFDEYVNDPIAGETYGTACVDDVADLLVEIGYNLSHGGNNRVVDAAQLYIDSPLLSGLERNESVDVFAVANIFTQYAIRNYDIVADKDGVVAAALAAYDPTFIVPLSTAAGSTEANGVTVGTQLYDFNISADGAVQSAGYEVDDPTDPASCANVANSIDTLWSIVVDTIQSIIDGSPAVPVAPVNPTGEEDYNQRIEENRIVGFVQNKYLSDTVASASPYVFNISLRSVWGLCGLLSDGAQSTGLRSMVLAQYTGISLQRDDRAFILNDTTTDAVEDPDERHSNSIAEYRKDWRHFHIKSRNNSFLQIVSVFAVGQADHFTVETGGDHSITNSNSNFGNQSLIAVSHRTEIFKQDNGAFVVGLVPPRGLDPTRESKVNIYNIDFGSTLARWNAADINSNTQGFKKIYVKVNGESLIKEGDIPEYYSIRPGTSQEQAELLVDDVNYILGKREYEDGFPEAIYARLPKNFDEPQLETFAARLRDNTLFSGSPEQYEPLDSYSEGKITNDGATLSGGNIGPGQLETSVKNFSIFIPLTEDPITSTEINDAFTTTPTNQVHFGFPTGGGVGPSTTRFKLLIGNNTGEFRFEIAEASIKTVACEGTAVPVSDTDPTLENIVYQAVAGVPQAGQVQYTYTQIDYGGNLPASSTGQGARFDIYRTQDESTYAVKIDARGVTYNIGDQFAIDGADLGGISSTDPAGHVLTLDNATLSGGSGYSVGTNIATTGGTGTNLTVDIISVDENGAITELKVNNGGGGYNDAGGESVTITGGTVSATIETEIVELDPSTNNNDLIIHVVANDNSGTGIGRNNDFPVLFTNTANGTETLEVRTIIKDVTLPANVSFETNELYTFDSINDIDYTIPSGGFDAEYIFSLVKTVGPDPWVGLGEFEDGVTTLVTATAITKNRLTGGSGFSATAGFETIKFPGSALGGIDGTNDFIVTVQTVGGATITTLNFNADNSVKRRYYGWEFARTVNGEYFGRLALLVDDERQGGTVTIVGIPGEFDYTNTGTKFNGYTSSTNVNGTATSQSGIQQSRVITTITNNTPTQTFTIEVDNPVDKPAHPFFIGDEVFFDETNNLDGSTLTGPYVVRTRISDTQVEVSVPNADELPTSGWITNGNIFKISEARTIPIQATIGNIVVNQGEIVNIYPNDWVIGAPGPQDYFSGWTSSGSNFSYDDIFILDTGSDTPFLPETTITFTITTGVLITRSGLTFSSAGIKEEGYLTGSALGIDYEPFDESKSLEQNQVTYNPEFSTTNINLSLLRRITQRVDTNPVSGALEQSDNFEFNDNVINSLYMNRIQDSRAANGNNELLWRLICKVPKDGYNNIKLRAPEGKFIIHLKDPGIGFGDETLDYPFVYDSAQTGIIRGFTVDTVGADVTDASPDTQEFRKTVKRGGDGTFTNYDLIDPGANVGGQTLVPSGATFTVLSGEVTLVNAGTNYNKGDRLTLPGGTVITVTEAVTTYPKSFFVRQIEPIVEYEYNVRDGYYLLTMLDGNIYEEYDAETDTVTNNDKRIVYGKQRLIGLEDIDPVDGIANEVNHLKQDGSDLIEKNRLFIQRECAGFLKAESQPGEQFDGFVNPDPDRCSRDVGHFINSIVKDLRLSGNSNIINNAQYYFSTGTQQFIETEITETRTVFSYARHLAIAAVRNWSFYEIATAVAPSTGATGDLLTMASTDGIVEGMTIYRLSSITALPSNQTETEAADTEATAFGFVGRVNRTTNVIEVFGTKDRNTRVGTGLPALALPVFRFDMVQGMGDGDWRTESDTPPPANLIQPVLDNSIIVDYDHATGECQDVVSAVNVLYDIHDEILIAEESDVSAVANLATFTSTTLNDGDTIRIFGAQNPAFNGEDIVVTALGGDQFTYDLAVTFSGPISDKILYYPSTVNFTEPTKASYDTEEVTLEGLGYNQNINYLYPEGDLDNPKWNPKPSVSQYRKDVGNTIIRDNTLQADNYQRISQYSITAESTKGLLNSVLTGGANNTTGYNLRAYSEIDLETEFELSSFGETEVTDTIMENPYGFEDSRNEYGVPKSAVLEFTAQNVPIFTDRCIIFNKAVPVSFYRPSIIRASSHTWEYVGFGPGNYSTGLPQFQDITLTQQEIVNSQTIERGGGFVASSGTNSTGDFFIGNQVIDAKGNQSNTLNFPRLKTSAENRLIDYTNLDSLAANSSTASFNPSTFSAVLTNDLQAIQEAQRNSFKASNIESSILTVGTLKINNKISISNNVFENEENFPVARQDNYGFTKRAPINWFNNEPSSDEYQALGDDFISPTDLSDWANVNSLIPSVPVAWNTVYKTVTFNEVSNVGDVDINDTLTKSVNFNVTGIDPIDERWYDAVTDTLSIPLGTPVDTVNNTTLATYDGRAGQIYVTFSSTVKAASIIPTNIWKPLENTWTGVSPVDGSPTTFIQGDRFVISYYIASGQIIYSVSTLDA